VPLGLHLSWLIRLVSISVTWRKNSNPRSNIEGGGFFQIKYIKEKDSTNRDNVQAGQEVTHSHEEYEVLTRKMHEAEELANKRVAAAIAQVGFESEILELHAFCPGLLVFCITAVPLYPFSHI
jgi:hypothetical protein